MREGGRERVGKSERRREIERRKEGGEGWGERAKERAKERQEEGAGRERETERDKHIWWLGSFFSEADDQGLCLVVQTNHGGRDWYWVFGSGRLAAFRPLCRRQDR